MQHGLSPHRTRWDVFPAILIPSQDRRHIVTDKTIRATRICTVSTDAHLVVGHHVSPLPLASGSPIWTRITDLRRFCRTGIAFVAGLLGGGQDSRGATKEAGSWRKGRKTQEQRVLSSHIIV